MYCFAYRTGLDLSSVVEHSRSTDRDRRVGVEIEIWIERHSACILLFDRQVFLVHLVQALRFKNQQYGLIDSKIDINFKSFNATNEQVVLTSNQKKKAGRQFKPVTPRVDIELRPRHPFSVVAVDSIDEQRQKHHNIFINKSYLLNIFLLCTLILNILRETNVRTVIGNTKKNLNRMFVMKLTDKKANTTNSNMSPKQAKNCTATNQAMNQFCLFSS